MAQMTKAEAKSTIEAFKLIEPGDVSKLDRIQAIQLAKGEALAVKAAKLLGVDPPATPVLDYMKSADYKERQNVKNSKSSGTGSNVRFTESELEAKALELLQSGVTTKAGMLKALRAKGEGARQQRFFPIAQRVIDRNPKLVAAAVKVPATKAPAKSASKTASKTVTPRPKATETGKQRGARTAAAKSIEQRRTRKAVAKAS